MPKYVDGFLLVIPKDRIEDYRKIAKKAGKIWKEHGALEYRETIGNDLEIPGMPGPSFPKRIRVKESEAVVFSWILYKSKAQRDRVNKKVMADPRLQMDMKQMPFDAKRMSYGGFEVLVDY